MRRHTALAGKTVVNLFFEPSTRTRSSFELAARRLGADVLNLDIGLSSAVKGESLEDTLYTLEAMNADVFVVRHKDAGVPALLAQHAAAHVHVLNAGEAHVSHPTQGLLDALTIRRHKPNLASLERRHRGRHQALPGGALRGAGAHHPGHPRHPPGGPEVPAAEEGRDCRANSSPTRTRPCAGADVVMMLRIQKERMQKSRGAERRAPTSSATAWMRRASRTPGPTPSSCTPAP